MSAPDDLRVSVVVLAKDTRAAKTRLQVPREDARRIALRLAASTVRAALAAETVGALFVVTGDAEVSRDAVGAGAHVVPEPRPLGMNGAAVLGRRRALDSRPHAPVGVIVADLPLLRPVDLDAAVCEFDARRTPLFLPDHEGTGTTFLIHGADDTPVISFGPDSAASHCGLGYRRAASGGAALRNDLDTAVDLADLKSLTVVSGG